MTVSGVFLAVYMAGKLLAVVPVPMDIDQCRQMAGEMLSEKAKGRGVALVCTVEAPR